MIDDNFIIRYTNALYSTSPEYSPRYDEFRDMFSSGQLRSKDWVISELKNLNISTVKSAVVVGAWYGTLGLMIHKAFPDLSIKMLDFDSRCEKFISNITYDIPQLSCITADMYDYKYTEDLVINTSCEHIPTLGAWLSLIPEGTTIVMQSNNFKDGTGHVNCVQNINEFIESAQLNNIIFSGELIMPMYTRYMIIGKK